MKNNIANISILLVSFIMILFACNKDEAFIESAYPFENPKTEIGKLHNEQLKYILENVGYVPENVTIKQHVENILNSGETIFAKSTVSLSVIPDFPKNIGNLDLYEWLNEFEISKTFDLFQAAKSLNEIIEQIEQKEITASELFQGKDLELYYEHLAVAKYTSIFWYPESEGGLNGVQYLNASNLKSTKAVNWWKVLGVDCVGGMMGGPGGYAGASAIAVIMQL